MPLIKSTLDWSRIDGMQTVLIAMGEALGRLAIQASCRERPKAGTMFALDLRKLEMHEKELDAVSRLETSITSGEILLMFFHIGEGFSDRAFIETLSASDFAKGN
jgi:hypothetical protein